MSDGQGRKFGQAGRWIWYFEHFPPLCFPGILLLHFLPLLLYSSIRLPWWVWRFLHERAGEAFVVKLRLKRFGRRHRPYYRLCAMDTRSARDSKAIEELGTYNPIEPDADKQVDVKADRVKYWLSVGAQPSDTVRSLLRRVEIDPTPGQKVS